MIESFKAAESSLKTVFNIAKGIFEAHKTIELQQIKIDFFSHLNELQDRIDKTRSDYRELLEIKEKIELELKNKVEWEKTKDEYESTQWAPQVFAYRKKSLDSDGQKSIQFFCPSCFSDQRVVGMTKLSPNNRTYHCPKCDFKVTPEPAPQQTRGHGGTGYRAL